MCVVWVKGEDVGFQGPSSGHQAAIKNPFSQFGRSVILPGVELQVTFALDPSISGVTPRYLLLKLLELQFMYG